MYPITVCHYIDKDLDPDADFNIFLLLNLIV